MKDKGVISEKEKLSTKVKLIAKSCKSLNELASKLESKSLEPYYRNRKLTGVWLGNRKYRLTTLGVGKELTREQKRLDELLSHKKGYHRDLELEQ